MQEDIRLTHYSRGAGCGCKISPKMLEEILNGQTNGDVYPKLIVGNNSNDDAAVFDLGNGTAMISTTDFFMPIVDDAFAFGQIAAANAISDVYAMGGNPLMAVAILGWPVEKLPLSVAQQVIAGGRAMCKLAGIPLAGGHSIDSQEPIFGLAVSGIISLSDLKKNNTAREGDWLYLTKPLGSGVLTTAQKRGVISTEHLGSLIATLTSLNAIGKRLGSVNHVHAMTDVTGFGILGHLIEMTDNHRLQAELYYDQLPTIDGTKQYIAQRIFPDATTRNWSSYSTHVKFEKGVNVMEAFTLLPDPQTNGGLLIAVGEEGREEIESLLKEEGLSGMAHAIGRIVTGNEKTITIK